MISWIMGLKGGREDGGVGRREGVENGGKEVVPCARALAVASGSRVPD